MTLPPGDPRHGTNNGYQAGCNCPGCMEGHRLDVARRRAKKRGEPCEVCGVPVRADYVQATRRAIHGHHPQAAT